MKDKYLEIVERHTPKENRIMNMIITFLAGGILGTLSEALLRGYMIWFNLSRKDAGVMVILTLIVLASLFTAMGFFDTWVNVLKSALIIPITGFAHAITSAAIEYRREGLILGIGSNIFKLAGSVILYGIVSVYVLGILRVLLGG